MAQEVWGVDLRIMHAATREAAAEYGALTGGEFLFDCSEPFVLTPDKPNTARMPMPITRHGERVADGVVIVFAPGDGTGDTKKRSREGLDTDVYPNEDFVVPRPKDGIDHEAHLTVVTFDPHASPRGRHEALFAGRLHMLGEEQTDGGRRLTVIGILGQDALWFFRVTRGAFDADPTVTLTTGYHSGLEAAPKVQKGRFGDPHAVLNQYHTRLGFGPSYPDHVQVCAFVSVSDEQARNGGRRVLQALGAVKPADLVG